MNPPPASERVRQLVAEILVIAYSGGDLEDTAATPGRLQDFAADLKSADPGEVQEFLTALAAIAAKARAAGEGEVAAQLAALPGQLGLVG